MQYSGQVISSQVMGPMKDKTEAIQMLRRPAKVKKSNNVLVLWVIAEHLLYFF